MTNRCLEVEKLVSLKVVEFMMELHHGSSKWGEASVEASPHRLPLMCGLIRGRFHKKD